MAYGATLRPDLGEPDRDQIHHTPPGVPLEEMFGLEHRVELSPGGILERALGASSITIVSAHFQGIAEMSEKLTVEATSDDGIIEAIRPVGAERVLAVQWHPEWRIAETVNSLKLFAWFGMLIRGASPSDRPSTMGMNGGNTKPSRESPLLMGARGMRDETGGQARRRRPRAVGTWDSGWRVPGKRTERWTRCQRIRRCRASRGPIRSVGKIVSTAQGSAAGASLGVSAGRTGPRPPSRSGRAGGRRCTPPPGAARNRRRGG